jgi:hypothetical protein
MSDDDVHEEADLDTEAEPSEADLSVVFGELDDDQRAAVQDRLDAGSKVLTDLAATLGERSGRGWDVKGPSIEVYDSGQAMITGVVKDDAEGITFDVELRPSNFFDDVRPWRPGEPPRAMSTEAWDVEGEALVLKTTKVSGRKYTIQETAGELEEERFDSPEDAAAAFVSFAERLAELALSRDPVAAAWQSDIEEYGTPAAEDVDTFVDGDSDD